ncbi:hypothetical protein GGX14DRAFT_667084 [Mycena pura]|uniref:Uncharacterized protein n=1 Tax=Mycena pura TaxID=153505 RepID=A0AAD6Y9J8_9AGAR|nr:hypothetical protein GGX14DRAFT_667084 [Mycena pura]
MTKSHASTLLRLGFVVHPSRCSPRSNKALLMRQVWHQHSFGVPYSGSKRRRVDRECFTLECVGVRVGNSGAPVISEPRSRCLDPQDIPARISPPNHGSSESQGWLAVAFSKYGLWLSEHCHWGSALPQHTRQPKDARREGSRGLIIASTEDLCLEHSRVHAYQN